MKTSELYKIGSFSSHYFKAVRPVAGGFTVLLLYFFEGYGVLSFFFI